MTSINQDYEVRKQIFVPYCCECNAKDKWWPARHHQLRLAVSLRVLVVLNYCHSGKLATRSEWICHSSFQPSRRPEWRQLWLMLTRTVTGTFYCHFRFRVIYISIGSLTKTTPYVLYESSLLATGFGKDWLRVVFGVMTGGQGEWWKEVWLLRDERGLKVCLGCVQRDDWDSRRRMKREFIMWWWTRPNRVVAWLERLRTWGSRLRVGECVDELCASSFPQGFRSGTLCCEAIVQVVQLCIERSVIIVTILSLGMWTDIMYF